MIRISVFESPHNTPERTDFVAEVRENGRLTHHVNGYSEKDDEGTYRDLEVLEVRVDSEDTKHYVFAGEVKGDFHICPYITDMSKKAFHEAVLNIFTGGAT